GPRTRQTASIHGGGAGESAEGVGLRRPVERAGRLRVAVQVVLGPAVVSQRLTNALGRVGAGGGVALLQSVVHVESHDERSGEGTTLMVGTGSHAGRLTLDRRAGATYAARSRSA